jgi:hypothetical protein
VAELKGKDYIALRRLSNGDDDVTYAEVGEPCDRVPVESLDSLLAADYIEPAPTTTEGEVP